MKKALRALVLLFVAINFTGCIFAQDFGEGADGIDPDTDAGDVSVDGMDTTDTGEDTVDPDTDMDVRDTRDGDTDAPDGDTDMNDADTYDAEDCDPDGDPSDKPLWYPDEDGDGYGDEETSRRSCTKPGPNYIMGQGGDCNDMSATVNPEGDEECNGEDDDCDGETDEGVKVTWYEDDDEDGFGNPDRSILACNFAPGFVQNPDDCDDEDPDENPDATEVCDLKDNNCNGQVDEGLAKETYYQDNDGDGYGNANSTMDACKQPPGYTEVPGDCNDTEFSVNPDGKEAYFNSSGQFVNNCIGGLDEDCANGPDDAIACGDDDGDGTVNAVDPLYMIDTNSDGKNDAVCVEADKTIDSAWWVDAYYQGSPTIWGGYQTIDTNQTVSYDSGNKRWCHSYLGVSQSGDFHFRFVSTLDVNQNPATASCQNGWKVPDIGTYCSAFSQQDALCRGLPFDDGCNIRINWGLHGNWNHTTQELTPVN